MSALLEVYENMLVRRDKRAVRKENASWRFSRV